MTSISIRPAQPDDLQRLHEMIQALAYFHGDLPRLTLQTLEQVLFTPTPAMFALVAEKNAKLVGYVVLYPLFQLHFDRRGLELHHMFVDENSRGQGVGRMLIHASVVHAKSCECNYLSAGTHPDNIAAQDIYLANGFKAASSAGPRFRLQLE
ncbi:MAG: GNAT family N-acetyltransferase [Rhodobacteraceae bacterium]|nr:GNAT family N-acetyltransferase [Paracoccaceae bacterium]